MRAIDAGPLYEKACDLEAKALSHVRKIANDETKIEEWRIWSAILAERTAFKHDVFDAHTIEPEPHWIPCSERLPEDWVPVLVTLKKAERLPAWIKAKPENYYHFVDADVCENGVWSVNKKNVIAWMPLPEPARLKEDKT